VGHPLLKPLTPSSGYFTAEIIDSIGFNTQPDGTCLPGFELVSGFFGSACLKAMVLQDTTITIFPGNSGSPVTDQAGNVVGVINSSSGYTNYGAMIPLRFLKRLLGKL
jgi:S1-C subfamily serine protease